jgi:hypothetical protein
VILPHYTLNAPQFGFPAPGSSVGLACVSLRLRVLRCCGYLARIVLLTIFDSGVHGLNCWSMFFWGGGV